MNEYFLYFDCYSQVLLPQFGQGQHRILNIQTCTASFAFPQLKKPFIIRPPSRFCSKKKNTQVSSLAPPLIKIRNLRNCLNGSLLSANLMSLDYIESNNNWQLFADSLLKELTANVCANKIRHSTAGRKLLFSGSMQCDNIICNQWRMQSSRTSV